MQELDLLILGAGWTATFLIPLLRERKYRFAATTTDGRSVAGHETIKWRFETSASDDESEDKRNPTATLPRARTVLVTFPLTTAEQTRQLVQGYTTSHPRGEDGDTGFIQLGSTGIWQVPQSATWVTRHSAYNKDNARATAEDELLRLGGCVLNLAGLWGGERDPKKWVDRVAKSKEDVRGKKSLHMIHGYDVARAVLALVGDWKAARAQRWMLTDGFVYDWWALFAGWAEKSAEDGSEARPNPQAAWVYELMRDEGVRALPRDMEALGRCYDSREFWETFKLAPVKARI